MSRARPAARRDGGVGALLLILAAGLLLWAGPGALPDIGPVWPDTAAAPAPAAEAGAGVVVAPVPGGRVSSGFGPRGGRMHGGVDIAAPQGTPIRAVADAEVIEAGPATGYGLWVRLRHHDGTVSVYGHMHTITTAVGARVGAGEQIAAVGSRGRATGPHLHLEIWPDGARNHRVDPAGWLAARGARLTDDRSTR